MKLLMDYVKEAERRMTSTDNYYLYLLLKSKGRNVKYTGDAV
jgi:hypothetical protein